MSEAPYLVVADLHLHNWSAFGTTTADGMNSRLHAQLTELERSAAELLKRGGKCMLIDGDIFHQRGSITPEVFNPSHAAFKRILESGIVIYAIPGNHDLTGRDTTAIGNSFQTLGSLKGFNVIIEPGGRPCVFVPWCATKDELRAKVAALIKSTPKREECDLHIHVGVDGVLDGVPAAGLSAMEVASWGFKRVFAGDYHNHKVMEGGKFISVGALTHNTWGDIGSKAGYVFVYPDRIEWQASHAPSFVEITGDDDPDEIPLMVDGNFVRVRGMKLTDAEIKKFRKQLEDMGARGVTFQVAREAVAARAPSASGKASTLDESVDKFIDTLPEIDSAAVKAGCVDILNQVRSVGA